MEKLVTLEVTQSKFVEIAKYEMAIDLIRKIVETHDYVSKADIKCVLDAIDE